VPRVRAAVASSAESFARATVIEDGGFFLAVHWTSRAWRRSRAKRCIVDAGGADRFGDLICVREAQINGASFGTGTPKVTAGAPAESSPAGTTCPVGEGFDHRFGRGLREERPCNSRKPTLASCSIARRTEVGVAATFFHRGEGNA